MSADERYKADQIDRFRRLYRGKQGGIFTNSTRQKLFTKKGISGRGRTKNTFWYRQRENVRTALVDLQLFIELSGKSDIDQVITKDSLKPIIGSLLLGVAVFNESPDKNKAEVAEMLIRLGFDYFEQKAGENITLSHQRTVNEATDLSYYLLQKIKGERYAQPTVGLS
jgi:hypothetical protein